MIGDFLNTFTYDYLLNLALSIVPDTLDKREGSIIYDALAPVCFLLAQQVITIQTVYENSFVAYSAGTALDLRAQEQGLTRYEATKAVKKVYLTDKDGNPVSVPLGTRFSTISSDNPLIYSLTDNYKVDGVVQLGYYEATCETAGTAGNDYLGNLIAVSNVPNVAQAVMSDLITPARDIETDDELRTRYLDRVNEKSFGGNIAQYREELKAINGVGEVQIYPVWNGGGTVKISVIDTSYNPITEDFIDDIKTQIDPENNEGEGIGIAPIGHVVTIVTPTEVELDITSTITLQSGYTLEQVQTAITTAINDYLNSLKATWGVSIGNNIYSLSVYIARINSAILSVEGVANVTDTAINGISADLILRENETVQELPKLGEVTLNVTD